MSDKIDRDIAKICSHIATKGAEDVVSAWGRILIEWHQMRNPPESRPSGSIKFIPTTPPAA
jgi:hypothetical protein